MEDKHNIEYNKKLMKDAILNNKLSEFQYILNENNNLILDVNNSDKSFDILIFAIKHNASYNFIEYIIQCYKDITNDYKVLNYYIEEYIEENIFKYETPLHSSLERNNLSIIKLLLKNGADVNFRPKNSDIISEFFANIGKPNLKIFKIFLKHGFTIVEDSILIGELVGNEAYTPFIKAFLEHDFYCIYNEYTIINFLLINNRQIPLSNKEIKKILNQKAPKSQINSHWFIQNKEVNRNYLYYSMFNRRKFTQINLLCKYINDISYNAMNIIEDLYSAGKYEIIKMIVPQYFDINSRNENEESLLDIASLDFNYDMMVYLINEGAEIDYNKVHLSVDLLKLLLSSNFSNINEFVFKSSFVSFSSEKEKIKNIGYMLLYSIAYGKTEISKYFINKGADINGDLYNVNGRNLLYYGKCILGTNEYNCIQVTPLIVAILKQNLEITKYLISKGADVNKFGIDSNHLMNKNNKYITPLVCAIYNDNKDIGKCLIDHKVNVNDDYIQNKYDVKVKEKNGIIYEKPLYYAIKMKSEKMVKLILNLDVKYDEPTVIKLAISNYKKGIVESLMKHGVNFERVIDGKTPLMYALDVNNIYSLKYLVHCGVDLNQCINHQTILLRALDANAKVVIKFLIRNGVDINQVVDNETALFYSIRNSTYLNTVYLIDHGANFKTVVNGEGETPIDYAIRIKKWRIGKYLRKLGAKPSKTNDRNRPSKKNKKNNKRKVIYNEDSTEDDDDDSDWKEDDKKRKKKKTRKN